ncbi:hypothetical protein AXF42_Ash003884 [Apostasia shenzhenica]|uniref:DDE Tnp4 domain-containing protein n=1 Tax=Apostasia shenzhenica TaxID=1088818 RepID=A0A2I0AI64_9ASPA|nr:hypothetical protein AXF42_Ash003884 [Apostasia shenzhenica]
MFMRVITHSGSIRDVAKYFQYSLEIVSRYFNLVLDSFFSLMDESSQVPTASTDALGAINGTHISAIISQDKHERFINHKGQISQNVMLVVEFDGIINFVVAGWGGSTSDMSVLRWSLENISFAVPNVMSTGKYYLVDSGYANTDCFIAPYRTARYHLSNYREPSQRTYEKKEEVYNHQHAQRRNIVERTFGILKKKFRILTEMKQFSFKTQVKIIIICAIIYNFILRNKGIEDLSVTEEPFEMIVSPHEYDEMLPDQSVRSENLIGDKRHGERLRKIITEKL